MDLLTTIRLTINAVSTNPMDLTTPIDPLAIRKVISLADGNGAGQADIVWHDERTIAMGGNDQLDLNGGLTDAYGDTIAMATLRAIYLYNSSSADTLVVGRPQGGVLWFLSTNDYLKLPPQKCLFWECNVAVTAGTADKILFSAAGSSDAITYQIALIGATAP